MALKRKKLGGKGNKIVEIGRYSYIKGEIEKVSKLEREKVSKREREQDW